MHGSCYTRLPLGFRKSTNHSYNNPKNHRHHSIFSEIFKENAPLFIIYIMIKRATMMQPTCTKSCYRTLPLLILIDKHCSPAIALYSMLYQLHCPTYSDTVLFLSFHPLLVCESRIEGVTLVTILYRACGCLTKN